MKKLTCLCFPIRAVICLLTLFMMSSPILSDQPEDSYALLDAIFSDDITTFAQLLENGADPTYMIEDSLESSHWAMCRAAKKRTAEYLKLIAAYGWDLNFRQAKHARGVGQASNETALFCSVLNGSAEPFKYLIGEGVNAQITLCSQCENDYFKENIFEFTMNFGSYEKSFFLLKNTTFGAGMVSDISIKRMEARQKSVPKKNVVWFWKTVDALRALGHEVNITVPRPTD